MRTLGAGDAGEFCDTLHNTSYLVVEEHKISGVACWIAYVAASAASHSVFPWLPVRPGVLHTHVITAIMVLWPLWLKFGVILCGLRALLRTFQGLLFFPLPLPWLCP